MSSLLQVIIFSLLGGVFSLVGGFLLISNKKSARRLAEYATPFAAGALLAAAFFDLLVEASEGGNTETALKYTLVGILVFFLLERFLQWFHHHHEHEDDDKQSEANTSLIIIGDILHNFIDGIAIAAGFLVDPTTGVIVTIAVAAHEIPQEIGDFGLLLKKGLATKKVVLVNVLSAFATTIAAVMFFQIGTTTELPLDILLGLVAGFFIYIAVSDIIPTIHKQEKDVIAGPHTLLLILGVIIVASVTTTLHGIIEADSHSDEDGHSHSSLEVQHDDEENHLHETDDAHHNELDDAHHDEEEDHAH